MWTASELIPFGFDDGIAGEVHVCHKANNNTNGTEDERDELNPIGVEEGDDRHGDSAAMARAVTKTFIDTGGHTLTQHGQHVRTSYC